MGTSEQALQELCRVTSLSEEDAALLLAETGGDLDLALMLVQNTLQHSQKAPPSAHPAVADLQRAIDACSGASAAVCDLADSVAAFQSGAMPEAIARAQAAHHPLWQSGPGSHAGLLEGIDRWLQFLRGGGETESVLYERARRASAPARVIDLRSPE